MAGVQTPAISVVIVSRHRPDWLRRCLKAVSQLDYPCFETIVVACPEGASVARESGTDRVIEFDRPNISAARNAGVDAARGELVAFLDDDASPEPTWLSHLVTAFGDPMVAQAGGTSLGRNGITAQHGAALVDTVGRSHAVPIASDLPTELAAEGDCVPRLHGTNMMLRRSVVLHHGGFDERFAFYLDETDLTYRVAKAGGKTVFVPKAVVHHASGPSRFRGGDRTPRNVFEIAASAAVFHRKHCPTQQRDQAREAFLNERHRWITQHMQRGPLPPDRAWALIRELSTGYAAGQTRTETAPPAWTDHDKIPIRASETTARDLFLVSPGGDATKTFAKAKELVAQGARVTVFDFDRTARYHRVRYTEDGYWLHTGGVYGREERHEPAFKFMTKDERIQQSRARLEGVRSIIPLILANET